MLSCRCRSPFLQFSSSSSILASSCSWLYVFCIQRSVYMSLIETHSSHSHGINLRRKTALCACCRVNQVSPFDSNTQILWLMSPYSQRAIYHITQKARSSPHKDSRPRSGNERGCPTEQALCLHVQNQSTVHSPVLGGRSGAYRQRDPCGYQALELRVPRSWSDRVCRRVSINAL